MNKREYLVKDKTLTGLTKWLNSEENTSFKKKNNKAFTTGDVQNYINRKVMPVKMGSNVIELNESISDIKLYNIVKNE